MALEGAYAFDDIGSTTIVDHSGNGRDINLSGTNGAQVDGSAVLDDGALGKTGADTISLPAALRTAMETDDRTIMFDAVGGRGVWWVRFESASLDTGVFGALSLDSTNITSRARTQANVGPSVTITIGALGASRHNFCLVYVRSTGVLTGYYDGASVGTATFAPGTALYTGADDLNIAEWSSTGPALDNLRFFSHGLDPAEVADLAGTPVTSATEVTGAATAALGGLAASAVGTRAVTATAVSALGSLTASAIGTRIVSASAVAPLGGLSGTATAVRVVSAVMTATLGQLVATATAQTAVNGTASAQLGTVSATAVGRRATTGSAVAQLTFTATAIVPNPVPPGRIVVSGREPPTTASGREPPWRVP